MVGTRDECLAGGMFSNKGYCDWNGDKDFCFYNASLLKASVRFKRNLFMLFIQFIPIYLLLIFRI